MRDRRNEKHRIDDVLHLAHHTHLFSNSEEQNRSGIIRLIRIKDVNGTKISFVVVTQEDLSDPKGSMTARDVTVSNHQIIHYTDASRRC
jgi:hypothetical protein